MIYKIFIILIIFLISFKLSAFNQLYETKFYLIEIDNEIISDAKKREIEKIKELSFKNIIENILNYKQNKKFNKLLNQELNPNFFIRNILIEDEFISKTKYKSRIKINFDNNEIISILRNYKINYSDLISPKFLLVVATDTKISNEGLSKNNLIYNFDQTNNIKSLKVVNPDLSLNDRYILPYNKIVERDLDAFSKFSNKYNINNIIIIDLNKNNNDYNLILDHFINDKKVIEKIGFLNLNSKSDLKKEIFYHLDEWWKNKNEIDNSIVNNLPCYIKNANIFELYFINSKINLISQVKSNNIKSISYGRNYQNITFYGALNILATKLYNENIELEMNSNNKCIIKLK